MKNLIKYINTPSGAIILGSILIAISILISGGVLKTKGSSVQPSINPGTAQAPSAPKITAPPTKVDITLGHLPVKGDGNAKVAIMEFADMRCPFCEKFYTESEPQLLTDYVNTGKVKFAFRHFEFLGAPSEVAGNAIECANEQGGFWKMYDYLFKNQPSESDTSLYTTEKLTSVASSLNLNPEQFKSCLDSSKYKNNLVTDQDEGRKAGISATPSFVVGKLDSSGEKIIGGQILVGAVPYSTIKAEIDKALQ